jgi:phosphohistidine swiveling domain-containing protein
MPDICSLQDITNDDAPRVGGKALSLGVMARAGLPVPPGFCVLTDAYVRHRASPQTSKAPDEALRTQLQHAREQLGNGPLAVRSSSVAEDGSQASFAGQQETILGVVGEAALLESLVRCWTSLHSQRATAYRDRQGKEDQAIAVIVQRLVPAEVSGVLFTRDPLDPGSEDLLIEASRGLGDRVVSGKVDPDRFRIHRQTREVRERHQGSREGNASPPEHDGFCLDDHQLRELADLGQRVEELFGSPRDIEWAWAEGQFWLLQARPITTLASSPGEREQIRQEEIASLRRRADPGGTVWSRFNLAEILPEPTPMTWAIVRRLLAGKGGYGLMCRDLGFRPHPSLAEEGAYELIAHRPYCNLSREPLFYSGWIPLEHPFAQLKADPSRAFYPQPVQRFSQLGPWFWLLFPFKLPLVVYDSLRLVVRLDTLRRTFATHLRQEILPSFRQRLARAEEEDLRSLNTQVLLDRLQQWMQITLVDFARESLKPTALANIARAHLERWFRHRRDPREATRVIRALTMGVRPDPEADLSGALAELLAGQRTRDSFLQQFGHRGPREMELSSSRWSEDPSQLEQLGTSTGGQQGESPNPETAWEGVAGEAGLSRVERQLLDPQVQALQTFTALRETGKHYLMAGYARLRQILRLLDERFQLHEGIWFLTPEELPRLTRNEDLGGLIAERKRRRESALSLPVPPVLFSDDLEVLGQAESCSALAPRASSAAGQGTEFQGISLSLGVAEAPALVLDEPAPGNGPFILVCPSTDPSWVPLLARGACALVMETGGVLSHGAIVAREFGIPAVAGPFRSSSSNRLLPRLREHVSSGQRLRVDGTRGTVTILMKVDEQVR